MTPAADRTALPSRRAALGAAAGLGLLGLPQLLAGRESPTGRAKAVILVFNAGGPGHIDLWDPKPDAPDAVRGPIRTVRTAVPGLLVTEHLRHTADVARHLAVVRTVHHRHTQHNAGMHWSIVGRPYRVDSTLINPSHDDLPSFGTLVGYLARRAGWASALPPYVITPRPHCDSFAYVTPGQFGGCLGARYDPYVLYADPNAPDFRPAFGSPEVPAPERLAGRRDLLSHLDHSAGTDELAAYREQAYALIGTPAVRRAFDLSAEAPATRDRYGRHSWGQSHLLARRLVEAGCRFVTTVNGPSISWDTHKDNFNRLESRLAPPMDRAFSALISDLDERGLLDSTLVIWLGDFGRTPTINKDAGRDHWPRCFSAVLAGGGIRGGRVVGASDAIGAYPKDRPVTPADLHATVFAALGYDAAAVTYRSPDGRPFPLSDGTAIRELI
jgi:hypothetical protein